MTEKKIPPLDRTELRRRAEDRLAKKPESAHPPVTAEEQLRLHHELQVHQVELEMQNAELRQARDALEAALEKYTDLYELSPVGYFSLDRSGTVRSVNLTGASLMGIERSRLVGRHFEHFVSDESRPAFTACLGKIFASPTKEVCELTLQKEGETPLCVQIEGLPVAAEQECRIALIDITERKRAEETLRREKAVIEALLQAKETAAVLRVDKEIAEANARLKNQFLVNMSHELRTPMTGILGMLQFALEEELSPALREHLETAQSSARSLLGILNDILDMAKIEAGKLTIEETPFSLQQCIAEAVDFMTPEVQRKGLDIAVAVAAEVPETMVGDQMRLRQVLINLIGNAVKFTNGGRVDVQVSAGKEVLAGKRQLTFAVTDTGIGIPDDKKELLFQTFSQVDPSLNRSFGGTGLGLAISREIVELMGGTISFVSKEGVGSTFSFTIPLQEADAERAPLPAAGSLPSEAITIAPEGERMPRLLLVEDDSVIRQLVEMMLKRSNLYLDIAEDGLMAIEMWEKGGYDLVLMDIQMPRLNGFEATRIIREKEQERGGHTPIIAMTAHARKEDEESCLTAGMDAYISKPIDIQKSLLLIRELLQQKSGE